ncbi:helix-turn-helix domain-containing protein [Methyloversatilis discipulorum]|uniref:helix-turn-helix domain-containing protein n=1 Tax=Methyloversatilis discipulorum TaxID=1119528 RepID=UPI001A586CA3|nr:helix-turn-helix domain-containing protein [Methyloversatilis discipulorum]MBL8467346.1 helix-turn-helix domain-containing protein [Methyloversatilis discipulorum]
MSDDANKNRVIKRVCRILDLLKGQSLQGVRLADLARELDEPPQTVLRTLHAMKEQDAVQQIDERWALSRLSLRIHASHISEVARAEARLNELKSAGGRF